MQPISAAEQELAVESAAAYLHRQPMQRRRQGSRRLRQRQYLRQRRQEQERLFQLRKASEELRMLEQDIQSARHYFGIVERRAKAISEKFEES